MGLFSAKPHQYIEGYKNLSKNEKIISIRHGKNAPKEVYFPTMSANGEPIIYTIIPNDKVLVGTKIGKRTDFDVPIYSSVSGIVLENKDIFSSQIKRAISHIVIANDFHYEEEKPLKVVSLNSTSEEIISAIKEAGLVGMGGAGFPTYIKYNYPKKIETIIVNGVECEPYLTTDDLAMKENTDFLLTGCKLLKKAVNAKKVIIAFKEHKEDLKKVMIEKNENDFNVEIREVPNQYPMGWERVLIKHVTNKEYDKLPSEVGVIVSNVQTVIELAKTLITGRPIANRLVTVSGNGVTHPCNVLAPLGTLASELILACNGYVTENVNVIAGGPMCSSALKQDQFPILISTNALTVLKYVEVKSEPCLRCGACTMNCPAFLQPVEIKIAYERKDANRMKKLNVLSCIECGMCSYICPSKIEVTETVKKAKMIYKLKNE